MARVARGTVVFVWCSATLLASLVLVRGLLVIPGYHAFGRSGCVSAVGNTVSFAYRSPGASGPGGVFLEPEAVSSFDLPGLAFHEWILWETSPSTGFGDPGVPVWPPVALGRSVQLDVSVWWPIGLCMLPPVIWAAKQARRNWRRRSGQCGSCGYDLRGSEHRCPECGTPARMRCRTNEVT